MKLWLIPVIALAAFAQPPTQAPKKIPELQIAKLRAVNAEIENLKLQFKIAEFQEAIKPKASEQEQLWSEVCQGVAPVQDCAVDKDGRVFKKSAEVEKK